jgi:hypothetical protein
MSHSGAWIYMMLSSYDLNETKIGFSTNPLQRYKQGRTWDRKLGLYGAFFIPASIGTASYLEAKIFHDLWEIRLTTHDEDNGEWFAGAASMLKQHLEGFFFRECSISVSTDMRRLGSTNVITWLWGSEIEDLFGPRDSFAEELA